LAGLLLLAISILTYRLSRRAPYLAVGWLWFLGVMIPMIGLVQVGRQAYADRYMYLPIIGLAIMLAWGVPDLLRGICPTLGPRLKVLSVTGGSVLAALMITTSLQTGYWQDSVVLFQRALAVDKDNDIAYANLGAALLDRHRYREALACSELALRLAPGNARYLSNRATILSRVGRFVEAEDAMRRAILLDPNDRELRDNLEIIRRMRGRLESPRKRVR
jgi:tetratricopeptide (TPR) repeat protein